LHDIDPDRPVLDSSIITMDVPRLQAYSRLVAGARDW
jgi:hypothetical protein